MIAHSCNPDRRSGLPCCAGIIPGPTAWKVNAADAALPFLRAWYTGNSSAAKRHIEGGIHNDMGKGRDSAKR